MPIDQKATNELKQIYKEEFGEEISNAEALDMGLNLVNLFKAMLKHQFQEKIYEKNINKKVE